MEIPKGVTARDVDAFLKRIKVQLFAGEIRESSKKLDARGSAKRPGKAPGRSRVQCGKACQL
jgi:hypothetical protein